MPSVIQRYPAGLLGLLGAKGTGQTPKLLNDDVQAAVDITDYWAIGSVVQAQWQTNAANSVSWWAVTSSTVGGLPLLVPPGEFWWVQSMCARTGAVGAASSIRGAVGVVQNGYFAPWIAGNEGAAVTGEAFLSALQGPILLPPGSQIGVYQTAWLAGGASHQFVIAANVTVLPA